MLMEYFPPKIRKPTNGSLFYLLHPYFLPLLIIGLLASNIMISTRIPYHELKVREILLFTHSCISTGIHNTTLYPSSYTPIACTSGHKDFP